jgi:hypothetical protein
MVAMRAVTPIIPSIARAGDLNRTARVSPGPAAESSAAGPVDFADCVRQSGLRRELQSGREVIKFIVGVLTR